MSSEAELKTWGRPRIKPLARSKSHGGQRWRPERIPNSEGLVEMTKLIVLNEYIYK